MILLPFRESRALESVSVSVCLIRVFSSARKVFDCLFCCLFCFYFLVFFFVVFYCFFCCFFFVVSAEKRDRYLKFRCFRRELFADS